MSSKKNPRAGRNEVNKAHRSLIGMFLSNLSIRTMVVFAIYTILTVGTALFPLAVNVALSGSIFSLSLPNWSGIVYFLCVTSLLYVIGPIAGNAQIEFAFQIGAATDRRIAEVIGSQKYLDGMESKNMVSDLEVFRSRQSVLGEALARGYFALVTLLIPFIVVFSTAYTNSLLILLIPASVPVIWAGIYSEKLQEEAETESAPVQVELADMANLANNGSTPTELRVYGAINWFFENYRNIVARWAAPSLKANSFVVLFTELARITYFLTVAFVLWRSIANHDPEGALLAILASFQLFTVLSGVRFAYSDISRARRQYSRFQRIIKGLTCETLDIRSILPKTENALVELKNVCYEYPGATSGALNNVSISVPKRSLITIIGSNGSGKSTLAQILRGVRKPQEGTIAWASSHTEQFIAGVPQHPSRWELKAIECCTLPQIGENGPFTNQDAALLASGAAEVISKLPEGASTKLGESWLNSQHQLSGGQWQRLGNSRGLIGANQACLTVVDEPTSALDPFAEARLIEEAKSIVTNSECDSSVVMITHRISSALNSDYVILMEEGRKMAEGDPALLRKESDAFKALLASSTLTDSGSATRP